MTDRNYTPQSEASAEEQMERAESLQTQGRKGCKLQRINMAFTPSNYEYIKVMSRICGQSMTEFINSCIASHRESHLDCFEQAKDVIISAWLNGELKGDIND